jgi:hypothetical protein
MGYGVKIQLNNTNIEVCILIANTCLRQSHAAGVRIVDEAKYI